MEVRVGERAAWKSAGHPFRLDPDLKLTGIPTLFHWTPNGPGERDNGKLEAAATEAEAFGAAAAFINSTKV